MKLLVADVPRHQSALLVALMLAGALTDGVGIVLLVPLLAALDRGGGDLPGASLLDRLFPSEDIGLLLAFFVMLVGLRAALQFGLVQVRVRIQQQLINQLRLRCYRQLLHAEWRWLAQQRAAHHNAVLITNTASIGVGFDQLLGLLVNLVMIAVYFLAALSLSWRTALVAASAGAIGHFALADFRRRALRHGHRLSAANRALHQHVEQGLATFRLSKIFGNEEALEQRFGGVIDQVGRSKAAYSRDAALSQAAMQVSGAAVLALIVFAALVVFSVPLPVLLPMLLVIIRMITMLNTVQQGWSHWLLAVPALEEVRQMMARAQRHAEPVATVRRLALDRAITLSGISFNHAGRERPAIANISISIPANRTTAICGKSGSGKSTLADLIMGLLEPDSGTVMIDDVPLTGDLRRGWRQMVSYVEQSPLLVHDTIRANLLWGDPQASDAAIAEALSAASADFVLALPDGLDTMVGDGGLRLSGGERQRINLARALLRKPTLLILDEATSALDRENEETVQRAIARLQGRLTVLSIGHRDAVRDNADQVIMLKNGQIDRVMPQSTAHPVQTIS